MRSFISLAVLFVSFNLSALTYKDINNCVRLGFDAQDQLVEETITGNLTGTSDEPESYTTRYAYSDDGKLIRREEDNGIITELTYDDEDELTEVHIGDDSYRKRLVFSPSLKQPEMLIEYLYDPETDEETVTRRVENGYSDDAKLVYQEFFSQGHDFQGQMLYHYDALGNRIGLFDHEGNGIEQTFDVDGKCLSKTLYEKSERSKDVVFSYDEEQRPIVREQNSVPTLQEFNDANQCIAETDAMGNRIEYRYDGEGHLGEAIYPLVLDCDDQPYQPAQKWGYDALGRVIRYQDLRGDTLTIEYTSRGQPIRITYPDGSADRFEYHLDGTPKKKIEPSYHPHSQKQEGLKDLQNVAIVADCFGQGVLQHTAYDDQCNTTVMTLDALGRIAHIVKKNCFGEVTLDQENRYDGAGNKTCERQLFLSPDGEQQTLVTKWEYGPKGRLERVFEAYGLPEQKVTQYTYDAQGHLDSIRKPDGVEIHYDYDDAGKMTRVWSTDNSIDYFLTYDGDTLVGVDDAIEGQNSVRHYLYKSQLSQETLGNGLSLTYTYDDQGRRTSCQLPDGSGFFYEWDEEKLIAIHRIKKNGTIRYSYALSQENEEGGLIGGLGSINFNIDEEGRCHEIVTPYWAENVPVESYDDEDKLYCSIISDSEGTKTTRYRYDDRSRLIEENETQYQYDTLSNRYATCDTKYNALCQLLHEGENSYHYDTSGNLIAKISGDSETRYQYDALNRMTDAITSDGKRYHYTYDYFNRRLSKTTFENGAPVTFERYLYDGDKEIGAVDDAERIHQLRMLGPGLGAEIGAAVAIELKGKTYAPVHDHRGSVACLVRKGQAVETYRYNAFGEEVHSDARNPWRFSSKRHDPETGLVYFGKRYYHPETGRWTTQDPLGFIEGANRYQFAGNNPVTEIDLYGSFSLRATWCTFYEYWDSFATRSSELYSASDQYIKNNLSFESYIKPTIDECANHIFSEAMLVILGYHNHELDVGVYGKGELSNKVRVTVINGILNIRSWAENNAQLLSKTHADINVHYIFRPTRGWTQDLVKGTLVKFGYASEEARLLANTWKQLLQEMGGVEGGGIIVHYAHSIGGADTSIARQFLTAEEQKMIRVISLGSPMIISHEGFHSVMNYMSLRDGIFFLAPLAHLSTLFTHNHNIIYLDSYWGIPIIDHLMNRGSYRTLLETLGHEFIEEFLKENQ